MPRIPVTSKGLSWGQPPEPAAPTGAAADYYDVPAESMYHPDASGREMAFSTSGTPVLGPPPGDPDMAGASTAATFATAPGTAPAVFPANLSESTPLQFFSYLLVLAMIFYCLNLWIAVLGQAITYSNAQLAMASWPALPGAQLLLFAIGFTLLFKYLVDSGRALYAERTAESDEKVA